jgi:DNA-binding CsgD family transcriptional regulator
MAELVRAALACGELDTAGRWVARAEQAARQVGLRGGIAHADRARAELALARAEPQAALVAAQSALERYQLLGYRLDAARVRSLIGLARFELGEPERAVSDLRLAHHELGACGAHRWERTCAAQLRERGARPRAASSPSLHTLSERERQVSRLVAHGLTNREIAARLHLSEKTVESHLLRIFDKLSVHSRAGLARSVERDRNTGSGSSLPRR